jgi:hypothetical protein
MPKSGVQPLVFSVFSSRETRLTPNITNAVPATKDAPARIMMPQNSRSSTTGAITAALPECRSMIRSQRISFLIVSI